MKLRNLAVAASDRWWIILIATVLAAGTAGMLEIIDEADARARSVAIAALAGALIGLAGAFVIDSLDDTVHRERDLDAEIGGMSPPPVLAVVSAERIGSGHPVTFKSSDGRVAEVYKALGRNIHLVGIRRPATIIQLASALPGEGCTATVGELAVGLARVGHSVAVIDADLRQPGLHPLFAVPRVPGLADILSGESVDFVAVPVTVPGGVELVLVPAGDVGEWPAEVLSNPRCHDVIRDLARRYDYVLIDSAAVLPSADAIALAAVVDLMVLVVQADRTSWGDIVESVDRLRASGYVVDGFVLNQAKRGAPGRFLSERLGDDAKSVGSANTPSQVGRRA
jgi:non-specific protein-tyrosine kinase